MIVQHHTIPFSAGHHLIIIVRESPVFLHQIVDGRAVAQSGTVVNLSHPRTCHSGVINQLIKSILSFRRHLLL